MKQLGILGKIIPEFKMIQGQMQFDMFHIYTVDEHTFKVVRNMRQMYIGTNIKDFDMESELIRKLPKIEILYLAGLFHDLGKEREAIILRLDQAWSMILPLELEFLKQMRNYWFGL